MRGFVLETLLCTALLTVQTSFALPRFALMTGTRCASCHVNPTGGQMRTDYGVAFSLENIPLEANRDSEFTFNPKLSDNISIGGDYRSQFIYDGATKSYGFHAMTASIDGSVRLGKQFTFMFKQDLINNFYGIYGGTEVFGIFKILPKNLYIKGGDFLPEFGWRLDDHTAYTRGGNLGRVKGLHLYDLLFVPNYKDVGVEVGASYGSFVGTAGIFNGDGNKNYISISANKALVGKLEVIDNVGSVNVRLGASYYTYINTHMKALTAGLACGDFVLMGEIDWHQRNLSIMKDNSAPDTALTDTKALSAYAEVDYRAIPGVWLIGKFDMFDPSMGTTDDDSTPAINAVQRITLGMEFFPYSFVEMRPQFRVNIEKPTVGNNNEFLLQTHLWF